MTAIDVPRLTEFDPRQSGNPYAYSLEGPEVHAALWTLATETPFIDSSTNPDIGNFAVYKLQPSHPAALVSRALEGKVILDEQWQKTPEQVRDSALSYEDNSLFFLVVDVEDPLNPKPAASLRIADCLTGGSETTDFYKESFGEDAELPNTLVPNDIDRMRGMWDVVGVFADKGKYRQGNSSIWAYHALYKASQEMGIHKWVSNITDSEYKNLSTLGIPFELIPGVPKVTQEREGRKPVTFGFYDIDVDQIRTEMTQTIRNLEAQTDHKDFYALLGRMARIAMDGKLSIDQIAA